MNSVKSIAGRGCFLARWTEMGRQATPIATSPSVLSSRKPQSPAWTMANMTSATPAVAMGTPKGSRPLRAFSAFDSGTRTSVMMMATSPRGMLIQKMARQLDRSISNAPTVGPVAAPAEAIEPQMPIAVARRCVGNSGRINASDDGITPAVPMPWTTRPTINTSNESAMPAMAEPSTNRPRHTVKTRRRPLRSARCPATSSSDAVVIVYAEIIHDKVDRLVPRSAPTEGNATFTAEASTTLMYSDSDTMANAIHAFRSTLTRSSLIAGRYPSDSGL